MLKAVFLTLLAGIAALAATWFVLPPSHDRDWQPLYSRIAEVDRTGPVPMVRNIRNWAYAPDGTPTRQAWIDREIDPARLARTWFVVEPFGEHPDLIAHTMFSFEFDDGSAYVVSVEARREVGEGYQALRAALVPTYEYMIVWATERDMYANSEFYTDDRLYLYELAIPPAHQRAVLNAMLDDTAELAAHPAWYNTLFANCSNVLARAVNDIQPGAIPLDTSWVLTGHAARFLNELGYIGPGQDFATLQRSAFLSPAIPPAYAETDPILFAQELRRLLAAGTPAAQLQP